MLDEILRLVTNIMMWFWIFFLLVRVRRLEGIIKSAGLKGDKKAKS